MYFFRQQMYQWDKEQIKVSMYNINNKNQTTILIILVCYIIYHVNGPSLSNSSAAHLGIIYVIWLRPRRWSNFLLHFQTQPCSPKGAFPANLSVQGIDHVLHFPTSSQ